MPCRDESALWSLDHHDGDLVVSLVSLQLAVDFGLFFLLQFVLPPIYTVAAFTRPYSFILGICFGVDVHSLPCVRSITMTAFVAHSWQTFTHNHVQEDATINVL